MIERWISSRPQSKLYILGFMSGALLVYSLSQFGHLSRMEERTERDLTSVLIKSPFDYNSRSLPTDSIGSQDLTSLENRDDLDPRQENDGSVGLDATRKLSTLKPGYLEEPIDTHDYSYIHNPEYTCFNEDGSKVPVVVLFFSLTAPNHFHRREAIRATYGNASEWEALGKYTAMRTVFLLGATSNATLQLQIDAEANHYGDIIQENFVDSYMNLTRKTVMGFKWVTNHCRHARYAMKIDDDTMMNQRRFQDIVLRDAPLMNYTAANALIGTPAVRKKSSKFYVSEQYYPSPTYPPYMDGPAYLLSLDLVEKVYKAALTTPLFKWEDAFVGMCLQNAGANIQGFERFLLFKISTEYDEYQRERKAKSYIFVSNLSADEMLWMWQLCHI